MSSSPHAVLVLGVPRGGTTWIGSMLGATRGARYVHEPDGTHEPFAFASKLDLLHHPMLEPTDPHADFERLWRGAFSGGAPAGGIADFIARRTFKRVSGDEKTAARQTGVRSARVRVVLRTARPLRAGKPVDHVVVKSVNGAFAAEWIAAKGAHAVGVVSRHPLNVVASWRDFGWNPPQGTMYEAIRRRALERWDIELPPPSSGPLARAAAMATSLAYELESVRRRHDEWVAISHEAVCADPMQHFAAIATRLGLEWNEHAMHAVEASNRPGAGYVTNRVAADEPGRWRDRLEPAEIAEITDVARRFPADLGWLEQIT